MALLDELENNVVLGVAAGIGAALAAPILLPAVVRVARPLLKGAMRAGIVFYDRGRETVAEVREQMEDMAAEVRAEMDHAEPATPDGASAPPARPRRTPPGPRPPGSPPAETGTPDEPKI